MKTQFKEIQGAIVAPKGFRASGVFCDIKRLGTGKGSNKGPKRDLALIVSETINARSRFKPLSEPLPVPSFLMSQNTPLARKPVGATMEPGISLNCIFIFKN